MALQVLVKEFVGYSALFLRTIEGKPTCPQYHKLDPYESCLVQYGTESVAFGGSHPPTTCVCVQGEGVT